MMTAKLLNDPSHRFHFMYWTLSLGILIFVALLPQNALSEQAQAYRVGIVPQYDSRKLHSIWRPILDRLEQQTGEKFELVGSPSIAAFEQKLNSGDFDFTYSNPYHLFVANKKVGYKPLLRDHSKQLQGILVVHKNSTVKHIADLQDQQVAFPDTSALGASLMMRAELKDRFKIQIIPKYVFTHDSVYLNVATQQIVAGGGVQKTLNRQPTELQDMLKVLHRTRKVAPHPFSVHPKVPQSVADQVKQSLLEIGSDEAGKILLKSIPIKQIGPASMKDYRPLAAMGLERFNQ